MKVISRFIRKAPANITVDDFLKGVTMAVRKKYSSKRIDFYAEHPEERITASCIVYSRLQRQLWIIGDCQCLVGKTGCKDEDRVAWRVAHFKFRALRYEFRAVPEARRRLKRQHICDGCYHEAYPACHIIDDIILLVAIHRPFQRSQPRCGACCRYTHRQLSDIIDFPILY